MRAEAARQLDIGTAELTVGYAVRHIDGRAHVEVFLADALENGAGNCTRVVLADGLPRSHFERQLGMYAWLVDVTLGVDVSEAALFSLRDGIVELDVGRPVRDAIIAGALAARQSFNTRAPGPQPATPSDGACGTCPFVGPCDAAWDALRSGRVGKFRWGEAVRATVSGSVVVAAGTTSAIPLDIHTGTVTGDGMLIDVPAPLTAGLSRRRPPLRMARRDQIGGTPDPVVAGGCEPARDRPVTDPDHGAHREPRTVTLGAGIVVPYPEPVDAAATKVGRANRRRDTRAEVALRSRLHRAGLRYRKDQLVRCSNGVKVRPDVVFTRARVAVFVDGCFWHGCPSHGTVPGRNQAYWVPKLETNAARDRRVDGALREDGWRVERVWEHDDPIAAAHRVAVIVRDRADRQAKQLPG